MIEQDLRTAMLSHTPLASLVGQRVFAMVAADEAQPPYVVYQLVAGQRPGSMSAPGARVNKRMQIACWSRTYAEAKSMALAAQDAIDQSVLFAAVFQGDADLFDPDTKLRGVILDYSLWQ